MINNRHLCLNKESQIEEQKKVILSYLEKGIDVIAIFDTETTGKEITAKSGTRDRMLEVAFSFNIKNPKTGKTEPIKFKGKDLNFREYINPFKESIAELESNRSTRTIHPEALAIHKITPDFLNGTDSLNGLMLPKAAPTFKELFPYLKDILCMKESHLLSGNMVYVAHNGDAFDIPFLREEIRMASDFDPILKRKIDPEGLFEKSIDTMKLMKSLYSRRDLSKYAEGSIEKNVKQGYSLSYLSHMLNIKEVGRDFAHGALLDTKILRNVFNALLETKEYKEAPNKLKFNEQLELKKEYNFKISKQTEEKELNDDFNILTLIKTDASLREGTGSVKEYIAAAKEGGLNNLAMTDVVTLNRFVEFYEGCKENDINPIIGTTFKIESANDVLYLINKDKKDGASAAFKNVVLLAINTYLESDYKNIESFIKEKKAYDINEWNNIINSVEDQFTSSDLEKNKIINNKTKMFVKKIEGYLKKIDKKFKPTALLRSKVEGKTFDLMIKSSEVFKVTPSNRKNAHGDFVVVANGNEGYLTIKKLITEINIHGQHFAKKGLLKKGEVPLLNASILGKENKDISIILGDDNDLVGRFIKIGEYQIANRILTGLKSYYGEKIKIAVSTEKNDPNYIENLIKIAKNNNIEILAAQRSMFAKKEDYKTHFIKQTILETDNANKIKRLYNDVSVVPNANVENYVKSKEQLKVIFENNNELLNNTNNFVKNIKITQELHKPKLPAFKTPNGETQADYLRKKVYKGLKKRLSPAFKRALKEGTEKEPTKEAFESFCEKYKSRVDYELGIIEQMDFPGYFLIKQQMIDFCKEEGIQVGAGRGSAAGSLVVYSLGITDVDPIEHDLIFERFLNPERKEMPDIDTDIDGNYRNKVLKFLMDQYKEEGLGYSGAAFIMTKGTFAAKNAIKNVANSLDVSEFFIKDLTMLIPKEGSPKIKTELEINEVLEYRYKTEPKTKLIIDLAIKLEENGGKQASIGKHAGGVVVGDLINQAPIMMIDGIPTVQYDKYDIEAAGAVKFDLLGLNNLEKLALIIDFVIDNKGFEDLQKYGVEKEGLLFNFDNFDYHDKKTYELLANANSDNVFQVESPLFKGLLSKIKPNDLNEITSVISLGRPGPLSSHMDDLFADAKFDSSKRQKYHDLIDPILDGTHGTIIYQEQVMAIAQALSGYTMGGADKLRKAMGKKIVEVMAKERDSFVDGAVKINNVDKQKAEDIFNDIETFAGYGFNKSHAMAYAMLTYKTAFFRANYPTEFMAAVMSIDALSSSDSIKKLEKDLSSAKNVGLYMYTPDINNSNINFKPGKTNGILYGLSAIKGASFDKAVNERNENGNYKSIEDYICRNGCSTAIEKLIKTGAMDKLALITPLSNEIKDDIYSKSKEELKIIKRTFLMKDFKFLETKLTSKDKIKSHLKESIFNKISDFEEIMKTGYQKSLKDFNNNKSKIISDYLQEEKDLLGGYITSHPINIGNNKKILEEKMGNNFVLLKDLSIEADKRLEQENQCFNIRGLITEVKENLISKKGARFNLIMIDDGTKTTTLFMSTEGLDKVNTKLRSKNKKNLSEGMIIGGEVNSYKDANNNTKISLNKIVIASENEEVILKEKKIRKNNFRM